MMLNQQQLDFLELHQHEDILDLTQALSPVDFIQCASQMPNLKLIKLEYFKIQIPITFKQLKSIKLQHLKLSDLNQFKIVFEIDSLTEIDLSNNQISGFTGLKSVRSTKLELLDLSWNQLIEVPTEVILFENLWSLKLNQNKIRKLPEFALKIEQLNIGFNYLSEKDVVIFAFQQSSLTRFTYELRSFKYQQGIRMIKELKINELGLGDGDIQLFFALTCLETLDISSNSITNLCDIPENMTLKHLNISNNKLTKLSLLHLFKKFHLWILDIQKNKVESLDELIPNMEMKDINLSFNCFKRVEGAIFMVRTQIPAFRMEYFQFYFQNSITDLDLSKMNLLDESELAFINELPLISLNLSYNKFEVLNNLKYPLLEKLIAIGNNLLNVNVSNLPIIKYLDLSQNNLTTLNLQDNNQIETLLLEQNMIADIQQLFRLKNLRTLNLASNQIEKMQFEISWDCKIQNLILSRNRLRSVKMLSSIVNLQLQHLNITQCEIRDATGLEHINCIELDTEMNKCPIMTLKHVCMMRHVKWVKLSRFQLNLAVPMMYGNGIRKLMLKDMDIKCFTEIMFVFGLKNLKELNLERNSIKSLDDLIGGVGLEQLTLSYNPIILTAKTLDKLPFLVTINSDQPRIIKFGIVPDMKKQDQQSAQKVLYYSQLENKNIKSKLLGLKRVLRQMLRNLNFTLKQQFRTLKLDRIDNMTQLILQLVVKISSIGPQEIVLLKN